MRSSKPVFPHHKLFVNNCFVALSTTAHGAVDNSVNKWLQHAASSVLEALVLGDFASWTRGLSAPISCHLQRQEWSSRRCNAFVPCQIPMRNEFVRSGSSCRLTSGASPSNNPVTANE